MGGFKMKNKSTQHKKPYHYKLCGLDNVYLLNGYELIKTDEGTELIIHEAEDLHIAIGKTIVMHDHALDGKEFRYLRKMLELTQSATGSLFGVDAQTVARWEKGESDVSMPADRLIRLLFIEQHIKKHPGIHEMLEQLSAMDDTISNQNHCFKIQNDNWKRAA